MLATYFALVSTSPWPSASSIIGTPFSSLARALFMSGLAKSVPVSTMATLTPVPFMLYFFATASEPTIEEPDSLLPESNVAVVLVVEL